MAALEDLVAEMGGIDLVVISSGTGFVNPELDWSLEQQTIQLNVTGVTALMNSAMKRFLEQGHGHLTVLSSVASIRGSGECPAYNASKAYVSNYLEGLRCMAAKRGGTIAVTDIRPGLVDTDMAKGEGLFWVMPVEKAAQQILRAIEKRKAVAVVTKRWALMGFLLRWMPRSIYQKL